MQKKTPVSSSAAVSGPLSNGSGPGADFCPVCRGVGFIHPLLANGRPAYGRVIPCSCGDDEKRQNLTQASNLGALRNYTFENLAPGGRHGDARDQAYFCKAIEAAKQFAATPRGWLVLGGPCGAGKTHVAAAIANECLKHNMPVLFVTALDLLDQLRAAFAPDSQMPYDRIFDQVRNTPLLILDDLTIRASTPWAQEKLDQLLNHRFIHELPTVVTTEMLPEVMDGRWPSWLGESRLCQAYQLQDRGTGGDFGWSPGLKLQSGMKFANFDARRVNLPLEQQENLERAYRLALDFAKNPEGWLVFQGTTGSGKTHLAAAIVNYRYQAQQPADFVVVPEFLDHLRSTFSPDSKITYDQLFERVKNTPLLILDDFGEQSATPWAQEKLYQVINSRYNAQLPTVITTSRALEELESRISSRLADRKMSTAYGIMAPDYRTDLTAGQTKRGYRRGGRRGE
jgi:DNA replication protein DnaC